MDHFNVGDNVTVRFYGKDLTGVVERVGASRLVWVRMDGPRRPARWFHPESVTLMVHPSDLGNVDAEYDARNA